MNKYFLIVLTLISILLEVNFAQAEVIYACTRRASNGVTQTYIAPLKNGVPVCNNKKHKGPFVLLDVSQLTAASGPDGQAGKDGEPGSNGANVTGVVRTCHFAEGEDFFQVAHCVLDGTSITYRHLFGDSPLLKKISSSAVVDEDPSLVYDQQSFTLYHVPAGTYNLKCDLKSPFFRRFTRTLSVSVPVTTEDSGTVDVGTITLCDLLD